MAGEGGSQKPRAAHGLLLPPLARGPNHLVETCSDADCATRGCSSAPCPCKLHRFLPKDRHEVAQGGEGQDAQERRCCEAYHCLFSLAEVPNCQSSYMRGGVFPSSHDGECASWLGAGSFGMGHVAVSLPSPPSCPLRGPWQDLSVPRVLGFSLCQASPPGRDGSGVRARLLGAVCCCIPWCRPSMGSVSGADSEVRKVHGHPVAKDRSPAVLADPVVPLPPPNEVWQSHGTPQKYREHHVPCEGRDPPRALALGVRCEGMGATRRPV